MLECLALDSLFKKKKNSEFAFDLFGRLIKRLSIAFWKFSNPFLSDHLGKESLV